MRAAWIELGCTVVAPTVVLLFGGAWLGPKLAVAVAVAFPLGFAAMAIARDGRPTALAALSLASVVITGGIGLLDVDPRWFAVKEAAIPVAIGALMVATASTPWSAIGVVLDRVLDPERMQSAFDRAGGRAGYDAVTHRATIELGAVTIASGAASFAMARWMVTAASGTDLFSTQLGSYTGWSFVAVTLPVLGLSVWVLRRALERLEYALGVPVEDLIRAPHGEDPEREDAPAVAEPTADPGPARDSSD
ncbi:MAG: VC0807 family protein [Myxococcota bacterium]